MAVFPDGGRPSCLSGFSRTGGFLLTALGCTSLTGRGCTPPDAPGRPGGASPQGERPFSGQEGRLPGESESGPANSRRTSGQPAGGPLAALDVVINLRAGQSHLRKVTTCYLSLSLNMRS